MMSDEKVGYNDRLLGCEQIEAEEVIASLLLDHEEQEISEEGAQRLSKHILYCILRRFRPEYFYDYHEPPQEL